MVHTRTSTRNRHRRWIVLVALLALVASACGSAGTADANTVAAADPAPVDEQPVIEHEDAADESAPAEKSESATATPSVLAYAIEASENLSYNFEQGMSMDMAFFGIELNADPDGAFVTGSIDGDSSYTRVDLGVFLSSMLDSFDDLPEIDGDAAPIDFSGLVMEAWSDGDDLVLDLSQMAASFGDLDPAMGNELAPFADGPVKLDLSTLAEAQDLDAGAIVSQFGQGAQLADPAALFDALRSIDSVSEVGIDTVNGVSVTVFEGSLNLADYTNALGTDVTGQLGGLGDLGIDPNDPMVADVLGSLDDVPVAVSVMIDDEDLVRRLEITIDMSPMFESMFGSLAGGDGEVDDQMAELLGSLDMRAVVSTWQTFDAYGSGDDVVLPDAEDRTAELTELLAE